MNSQPCTKVCPFCGSEGVTAHAGLRDRLFDAPGEWNFMQCTAGACGILWLDPPPSEEELRKAYADYHTHYDAPVSAGKSPIRGVYHYMRDGYQSVRYGYNCSSISRFQKLSGFLLYLFPVMRNAADYNACFLSAVPHGRVLDVGCGSGEKLKRLQELGWNAGGIDTDERAVLNAQGKGLRVRAGALAEQRYPDNHFDAIVLMDVIEHALNPGELIRECRRIVKPGGVVIVTTPNAGSFSRPAYGNNWRGLEPPRHLFIQTPSSLRKLAADAGFGTIRVNTMASYYMLSASHMMKKGEQPDTPEGMPPIHMKYFFRLLASLEELIVHVVKGRGDVILMKAHK